MSALFPGEICNPKKEFKFLHFKNYFELEHDLLATAYEKTRRKNINM
jgi:hypothetical protein